MAKCVCGLQITSWLNEMHYSERHSWVGLDDLQNENSFVWQSGRDLSDEVKSHWGDDQPNNLGSQDCVQIYKDEHDDDTIAMFDVECDRTIASVCQKRPPGKEREIISFK